MPRIHKKGKPNEKDGGKGHYGDATTSRRRTFLAGMMVIIWMSGTVFLSRVDFDMFMTSLSSSVEAHAVPNTTSSTNTKKKHPLKLTFQERLELAQQFANRVANNSLGQVKQLSQELTSLGGSEWFVHEGILAESLQDGPRGCLVYSVGIADHDIFTELMAAKGCQVIALDPTVHHPTDWMPNVTFYSWGLRNNEITSDGKASNEAWSHPVYGVISNESSIYTLPQIVTKLGHTQQHQESIVAFKLDCEGCEFATFEDLVTNAALYSKVPSLLVPPIRILSVEFHFASTLGMVTEQDVARIYYADVYLKINRCHMVRWKVNSGYPHDQFRVHPLLVEAGVPSQHCCYEMTYICGVE